MNHAPDRSSQGGPEGDEREKALREALNHAAHYLPDQGPIGVFVHHNPLHAFEHLPFHEAVAAASAMLDTEPYILEEEFRRLLARGRITSDDLDVALSERAEIERWPSRALASELLSSTELRRLALQYPIVAESAAGLRFKLDEASLATRLARDVPAAARARVIDGGVAWLRPIVAEGDAEALGAALTGERAKGRADAAMIRRFGVGFGPSQAQRLLEDDPEAAATSALWEACRRLGRLPAKPPPPARRVGPQARHRDLVLELTGEDVDEQVNPVLIRTAAAYLDEGMAYWPMPTRDLGYYQAVRALLSLPGAGPEPWLQAAGEDFRAQAAASADAMRAALSALEDLGVQTADFEPYVLRVLRALPGWAGMMSRLERNPKDRPPSAPPASLLDFLAVRLTLERAALREVNARRLHGRGSLAELAQRPLGHRAPGDEATADHDVPYRLFRLFSVAGLSAGAVNALSTQQAEAIVAELDAFDGLARRRVFHEAYERQHRREVLDALAANRSRAALARPATPARFQVIFCIDEREESIRRALEEIGPSFETFGVAGFFGLAIDYRGIDDPHPVPHCPAVATPAHEVLERPRREDEHRHGKRARLRRAYARFAHNLRIGSRSMLRGLLFTLGLGVVPSVPLVSRVLFPRATARLRARFATALLPSPETELACLREADAPPGERGKPLGFTPQEAADRVAGMLRSIGLTRGFGAMVVVLGHGSNSLNNPHESAHDCGACGGRRGGANGRLFAALANQPEVRALLRARGVDIPDSTVFVGGLHDTCTCAVTLYDTGRLPESHKEHLRALREGLDRARALSAHERCRRFEAAPRDPTPEAALRHVEARAESLSQPRPEYGHATNAACIVGRRALSRGLFLDRRSFLVSYDPAEDDDRWSVLERIIAAVGPVGAGINLEYYFSFVDNERYGCGTKLPHNITGLVGVMNGHASDLRTGLPWQMVEVHEPVRLVLVVEATTATLLAIAERLPGVRALVVHRWVQLVALDPESGAMHVFTERGFAPYEPSRKPLPETGTSVDYYRGRAEHLPPAFITRAAHPLTETVSHAL